MEKYLDKMMKIGVVVHGPQIVDTGFAEKILSLLENYGYSKGETWRYNG